MANRKENEIYASIIGLCEALEKEKMYYGNGHHLAQKITRSVCRAILSTQQKIIVQAMSPMPKTTKEISEIVNLPSKQVSSQLQYIEDSYNCLIYSIKMENGDKVWALYQ